MVVNEFHIPFDISIEDALNVDFKQRQNLVRQKYEHLVGLYCVQQLLG